MGARPSTALQDRSRTSERFRTGAHVRRFGADRERRQPGNPNRDPPTVLVVRAADRLKDAGPKGVGFPMKQKLWRAMFEIGFIMFLFYFESFDGGIRRLRFGAESGLFWGY